MLAKLWCGRFCGGGGGGGGGEGQEYWQCKFCFCQGGEVEL